MSPWIESVPYVATYSALLDTQIQKLLEKHHAGSLAVPVVESECDELLAQLRGLKDEWPQHSAGSAGPDPRTPIEAVARDLFTNLSAHLDLSAADCVQLWLLLDVLNVLSDKELCEPALSFWLVEELLDSQTIDGCKRVFDYLESRRHVMTAHFFREKSLVILRCCNELLRRLSRAEDTVFCGRVFIFLFQSFPLGDKSSVNLRGEFHVENVTDYDEPLRKSNDDNSIKPMEIDGQTQTQTPTDKAESVPDLDALYPKFWALQSLFSSPTRLFDPAAMAQLKDGMSLTLSCFRSLANSSSSLPITSSSSISSSHGGNSQSASRKRKASEIDSSATTSATSASSATSATPFNPKYLTNRDLFDLEVHDLAFRRHFLVQSLIMLDFLLSLSPAAKAKAAAAPGLTNKSVLYAHTLSEEDTKWCIQTRAAMASYLQQQQGSGGNEGKMYYRMVDTVLSRDKNWVRWKGESCPPITRPPVDVEAYLSAQDNLESISSDATRPLMNPPGAREFDFLLRPTTTESLKVNRHDHDQDQDQDQTLNGSSRYRIPTLKEFHNQIEREELDKDFATTEKEKMDIEERKMANVWRALRASVETGQRVKLAEALGEQGTNYDALLMKSDNTNNDSNNNTAKEATAAAANEDTPNVGVDEGPAVVENGDDPSAGPVAAAPASADPSKDKDSDAVVQDSNAVPEAQTGQDSGINPKLTSQ